MITVLGNRVIFKLDDGRKVHPGARASMMYDDSGRYWSKTSVLVGPYTKGNEEVDPKKYNGFPADWLGRTYHGKIGSVDLPPKSLSEWEVVGDLETLYYVRVGRKAPGGYRHTLNAPRGSYKIVHLVKGKGKAVVRKHGSFYRLDFSRGLLLDGRGIVWP